MSKISNDVHNFRRSGYILQDYFISTAHKTNFQDQFSFNYENTNAYSQD